MRKIVNLLILAIAIFLIFQQVDLQNQQNIDSKPKMILQENGQNVEVKPLGFVANFVANILTKMATSPQGQNLVLRMVKNVDKTASVSAIKTNNEQYFNTIFGIEQQKLAPSLNFEESYCSSSVIASYKITSGGTVLLQKDNEQLDLGQTGIPGLDNIAIGLKPQQSRKGLLYYPYAGVLKESMVDKTKPLVLEVTMHQLLSPTFVGIKVFDDLASLEPPLLCAEYFNGNVKIASLSGKTLFSKAISYQIGQTASWPKLFSYALFNKLPQAKRTIITPSIFCKGILTKEQIKANKMVLIELQ
jgi:hypothetical protein